MSKQSMFGVLLLILLQKITFLKHNILLKSSCFFYKLDIYPFLVTEKTYYKTQDKPEGETNLEVSTIVGITTWPSLFKKQNSR